MKSILIIAGLTVAMSSAYAAGNPFKPKPKPVPVVAPAVQIQQDAQGGGLTQEEVMALFEQRMALMMDQAKSLGSSSEQEVTQDEALESLMLLGLINKEYVYKDNEKGCYIYENAKSGEVVESRCYRSVVKRLRDVAGEYAPDQQPAGDNPSNP